jgi:hypothetical protein
VELTYEEYCPGCSKCVKMPIPKSAKNKHGNGILGWLSWSFSMFSSPAEKDRTGIEKLVARIKYVLAILFINDILKIQNWPNLPNEKILIAIRCIQWQ